MPSSEEIDQQIKLLATHRRRLAHSLHLQAVHGLETPFYVVESIREAREQIWHIKQTLLAWSISVDDHPDDEPGRSSENSSVEYSWLGRPTDSSSSYTLSTNDSPPTNAVSQTSKLEDRPNPFGKIGRITNPTEFFGREDLLRRLFEELSKGSNLSLVGMSQVGKSSLLSMICKLGPDRLTLSSESFVYLDMQCVHDENDFFEALCDGLGVPTCRGFKLSRALRDKRYIICLDEVEKMTKGRFTGDEREELRGLADGADAPLTLVIASRSSLDGLFPDSERMTSPLANICAQIDVSPFPPDVARAFIIERLKHSGVMFTAADIDGLVAQSNGFPARLQRDAAALFDRYRGQAG
jgi:hypothetical protein